MSRPRASSRPRSTGPGNVIEVADLEVPCIIGVYPEERHEPQPVVVHLRVELEPYEVIRVDQIFDYARIAGIARFLLQRGRFLLLENAVLALCRTILAPPTPDMTHPRPTMASVRMTKPRALDGKGIPSVTIIRHAADLDFTVKTRPFGQVDILHEQPGLGLYRLRIAPGGTIPTHMHGEMEEHELILGSGLDLQGLHVRPGLAFSWPRNHPHRYDNRSDVEQTILRLDRPAFIASDEIVVAEPPEGLQRVPGDEFFPFGEPLSVP